MHTGWDTVVYFLKAQTQKEPLPSASRVPSGTEGPPGRAPRQQDTLDPAGPLAEPSTAGVLFHGPFHMTPTPNFWTGEEGREVV